MWEVYAAMSWNARYDVELGIVEVDYEGVVSPQELEAAVRETIRLALETGSSRILSDCRPLTGGHQPSDLYAMARLVEELLPGRFPREAVLLPELPAAQPDAHFWESAATNRGMIVRLFTDRAAALAWLLAPNPQLD